MFRDKSMRTKDGENGVSPCAVRACRHLQIALNTSGKIVFSFTVYPHRQHNHIKTPRWLIQRACKNLALHSASSTSAASFSVALYAECFILKQIMPSLFDHAFISDQNKTLPTER